MPEPVPDTLSQCPAHALCMWKDVSYSGTFWHWNDNLATANRFHYVGNAVNDQVSSFFNNRIWAAGLGKDFPISNNTFCVPPNYKVIDLTKFSWEDGSNMNDSISSYELSTSTTDCPLQ